MTLPSIHARALQFPITMDVAQNVASIERLLADAPEHTLAVAPEGALSGYLPQPGFVSAVDRAATAGAIESMASICAEKRLHLIAGACILDGDKWRNASFYVGPDGERARYDKINLAQSERGTFAPGDKLPVFDIRIDGHPVRVGIQMCRELRYPEQWRVLAAEGAQVIAYVNNAIGSKNGDALWRAHMISRAAETQRFIVGANNAASDQTCPTAIIAPSGQILAEAAIGAKAAVGATLDLNDVSDWVLSQARDDVVRVSLRED